MKNKLSWTLRDEDGVKRETRAEVTTGNIKWQFKRAGDEQWDYDRLPIGQDWDELEEIMERRRGRGRAVKMSELVKRARREAGW